MKLCKQGFLCVIDGCYAGGLSGYIMDDSPRALSPLYTGMGHFFVASNVARQRAFIRFGR